MKQTSSWALRYLGAILIGYFSLKILASYYLHPTENIDHWLDRSFLAAAFTILLGNLLYQEVRRNRSERYADTCASMDHISNRLATITEYCNISRTNTSLDRDAFRRLVQEQFTVILSDVAAMFSMITNSPCRAAIKVVHDDDSKLYIFTFTRDRDSNVSNHARDKKRFDERSDLLSDNYDFRLIFEDQVAFFIENNLPAKPDYVNSSMKHYPNKPPPNNGLMQLVWRIVPSLGWGLPYKSTMVFPIKVQTSPLLDAGSTLGFLAIDSPSTRAFTERIDGPLGSSLAGALFAPFSAYLAVMKS